MQLVCLSVRDETADVRTYCLARTDRTPIRFHPGQAITLTLDWEEGPARRTFSIASSAERGDAIELTIKTPTDGHGTAWLRRMLVPGRHITASAPHGRFVLPDAPGPVTLVSAGSGATPLMAMLRTLAHRGADVDVDWVHVARTAADVLFGAELAALQERQPRLRVSVAVARPGPGWFGYQGRITRRLMSVMSPDLARKRVFCCGPVGFMDEVRRIHAAEGGEPDRLHIEHFAPPAMPAVAAATHAGSGEFAIQLGARSFPAGAGETILEAAARANVVIPCGCAQGICGTCRLKLAVGQVAMTHAGGLQPQEERDGWILACSARPRTDLVLHRA